MKCFIPYPQRNKFCPPASILPEGTLKPNSMNMSRNMRRSIQIRLKGTTSSCSRVGPPGPPGPSGNDGSAGANGKNGKNGFNGVDGRNGRDGRDGRDGVNDMYAFNFLSPITPLYNYPITQNNQIGYTNSFLIGSDYILPPNLEVIVLTTQLIPLGVWLIELTATFGLGTTVAQLGLSLTSDIDLQKMSTGNPDAGTIRLTTVISNQEDRGWNILGASADDTTYDNLYITLSRIA